MAEEKEILKIPILVCDNHDKWFRLMRIKLQGKGVGYVIEKTKNEYAAIAQLTPHTLAKSKNRVDDIIKGVEELDIDDGNGKQKKVYLNIERAAKYTKDEATAIMYIIHGLSDDDQALIDEYPAAIDLWAYLKKRFGRIDTTTASIYMTKLQTFEFEEGSTIMAAWDKLKDYHQKLSTADQEAGKIYSDAAMYLILTRSLSTDYKPTISTLKIQATLSVEEKLKHLEEQEMSIKEDTEHGLAAFKKSSKYIPPHHHQCSRSSDSDSSIHGNCHLCKTKGHFVANCPELEMAGKLLRKYHHEQARAKAKTEKKAQFDNRSASKAKSSSWTQSSSKTPSKKPDAKKSHGYNANVESNTSTSAESISDSEPEEEIVETAAFTKDLLGKAIPSEWPADTGASSHMSDQPNLFRQLILIKRRMVKVGGGVLYANHKGTANLVCQDGSSMLLADCLYIPDLGVNLLSARRLCEAGLKGSFNNNKMYFKNGKEKIVQAVMRDGLYIVTNIADGYEEAAFPGVETDAAMTKVEEHTHPHTAEELSISEQEIYILWHRRFSHLGPKKI